MIKNMTATLHNKQFHKKARSASAGIKTTFIDHHSYTVTPFKSNLARQGESSIHVIPAEAGIQQKLVSAEGGFHNSNI